MINPAWVDLMDTHAMFNGPSGDLQEVIETDLDEIRNDDVTIRTLGPPAALSATISLLFAGLLLLVASPSTNITRGCLLSKLSVYRL